MFRTEIKADLASDSKPKYKLPKARDQLDKAIECFLMTGETRKRFGHYFIDGNTLYYRTAVMRNGAMSLEENIIAVKLPQLILGNSSVLSLIGRRVSFGNERLNRNETDVQRRLALHVPMLPFSVFEQAGLDVESLRIVQQTGAETVTRTVRTGKYDKKTNQEITRDETVHFTGASVFNIGDQFFLFDADRRELEYKIFNPFLVKLPRAVSTVAEAYEILKPQAVLDAESKGLKVRRQGEWFFIPVTESVSKALDGHGDKAITDITLRAGNNRPNNAKGIQLHNGTPVPRGYRVDWEKREAFLKESEFYVTGKVSHSGREHADLILKGWYKAVPNTATESFTITGDID